MKKTLCLIILSIITISSATGGEKSAVDFLVFKKKENPHTFVLKISENRKRFVGFGGSVEPNYNHFKRLEFLNGFGNFKILY